MKYSSVNKIIVLSILLALTFGAAGVTPAYAATTVTTNADSGAGSLRQAIANAAAGDTINFAGDYTITLTSELAINQDLTIDGVGRNVIVSGNHVTRVFNVTAGTVAFNHLTIADGNVQTYDCGGYSLKCGGGLMLQNNSAIQVTVMNSAFSDNSASYGGGIDQENGTLTVTNSTFSGNSVDHDGGGIDQEAGTLTVTNSAFSGNSAAISGGGIYNYSGALTVTNSTFSGNRATYVGGIYNYTGTATLKNTIVANSPSGNNCFGTIGGANNLADDASCGAGFTNSASILLGALGNYGGGTQTLTFPLLPGSAAIDAGDSDTCSAAPVNSLDQRGVARPVACDIGAFESRGFTLIKTGGDNQSTLVNTNFPSMLTLMVTSAFGEPVDGGVVTFTGPASGASTNPMANTATISGGAASRSVTANGAAGGPYNVVASAAGAASMNFSLTNRDTTPPVVTVPSDLPVEATGPGGAVVTFFASATDETSPPNPVVTCDWPSGSIFPIATTNVHCWATDDAGNTGHGYFNITVQDTTAPIVTVPANMIEEATGPSGAVVTYPAATATDTVDPLTPAVTCVAPSGSTFPLGVNTVNCSATDTAGNTGTKSFTITVRDTIAPVVTVPANMIVEATGPGGAIVTFSASATDNEDGSLTPTCTLPSGSLFPLGLNTVTCQATDTAGNTGYNSFTIAVGDTTPPVVTVPANMAVGAASAAGAVVSFSATATDTVDPLNPAVTCIPPSGSLFPLGVNTVTCFAVDTAGNTDTKTFTITVQDANAPIITVPSNMIVEATGPGGAVVAFTVTATDIDPVNPAVTCVPASGSLFPLGVNTVNCSATDTGGNTGRNFFTITVRDTTAPVITVPANMVVEATSSAGRVVTYPAATATDTVDPLNPAVTCLPPSGSTFPIGVNTVNCSATDTAGNIGTKSFTITVQNTAPVAGDDTYATTMSVFLNGTTVLVNDTDVQGDPLTAVKVTDPAHASAFTFNADGTFTYEPENGFRGTDTFTYMANDGLTNSNVATVSIAVSPLVMTFNSISKYDGWILESLENSNKGGSSLANQILRLGDSLRDQQYRSILSFNASTLPAGAVIVGAAVKVHHFDVIGVNPFTTHGNLITDMRKGSFGGSPTLKPSDFQAAASKTDVGRFALAPGSLKWYQLVLAPLDFQYINPSGITQFRLRFTIQDNDNMLDDIVRFASGDSVKTGRPILVIEYYVP